MKLRAKLLFGRHACLIAVFAHDDRHAEAAGRGSAGRLMIWHERVERATENLAARTSRRGLLGMLGRGTVALAGIHMSPIPPLDYSLLYHERVIRSVANNTRQDGQDFLRLAAEIPIRTEIEVFPLGDANRALNALKNDAIRGAAVLRVFQG